MIVWLYFSAKNMPQLTLKLWSSAVKFWLVLWVSKLFIFKVLFKALSWNKRYSVVFFWFFAHMFEPIKTIWTFVIVTDAIHWEVGWWLVQCAFISVSSLVVQNTFHATNALCSIGRCWIQFVKCVNNCQWAFTLHISQDVALVNINCCWIPACLCYERAL